MPGSKDEDPLAVAAFGDVDTSGALSVRSGSGSDWQTECGRERTANVGGCVVGRDASEELRTGRPGEDGLPELNVGVGDLKFPKKPPAADDSKPGVLARERETGASPRSKERRDRSPLRRWRSGQRRYSTT